MNENLTRLLLNGRKIWMTLVMALLFAALQPALGFSQANSKQDPKEVESDVQDDRHRYKAVINELAQIESKILDLQNSEAQRTLDEVESTLVTLQAKRQRLDALERQWKLLSEGKPAIEIEPRLNLTTEDEKQLLIELEGSKENVLRSKALLLRLKSEFGPGHPSILDTKRKLSELESVVSEQTEVLEDLGVEVKSAVAKQRLRQALLERVELKTKFGPGHPNVSMIEAEIAMLNSEMNESACVLASHTAPALDLVNANLELREAETKYGEGHPVFKKLKQKIKVLEELAETTAASDAPVNKQELARRLEARIEVLQNRILDDEAGLDSVRTRNAELKGLEEKTQSLLKQRSELNNEMARLLPLVDPDRNIETEDRVRVSRQLLSGIEALEFLGKSDEAKRLRKILSGMQDN